MTSSQFSFKQLQPALIYPFLPDHALSSICSHPSDSVSDFTESGDNLSMTNYGTGMFSLQVVYSALKTHLEYCGLIYQKLYFISSREAETYSVELKKKKRKSPWSRCEHPFWKTGLASLHSYQRFHHRSGHSA